MDWFRGTSVPSEGNLSAIGAALHDLIRFPLLSGPTFEVMSENKTLTAGIMLGLAIIFAIRCTTSPWRKLPPCPRRLPILGNVFQLRDRSWLVSKDCKERFGESADYVHGGGFTGIVGDIMYLDGAGQPIVVCNSLKSAFELLERRSANYSDRPRFIMAQEILNGGLLFSMMNHDDR